MSEKMIGEIVDQFINISRCSNNMITELRQTTSRLIATNEQLMEQIIKLQEGQNRILEMITQSNYRKNKA